MNCVKVSKYGVFSGPYFPVFSPNTGKYGPEITPYLDTFHAVMNVWDILYIPIFHRIKSSRWQHKMHCVKSVQIWSFSWSLFSCIRTEYEDLRSKPPYSAQIQENTNQKKLCIWTLFT